MSAKIKHKWATQQCRLHWDARIIPGKGGSRKSLYLRAWKDGYEFCKKLTEQERNIDGEMPWEREMEGNK